MNVRHTKPRLLASVPLCAFALPLCTRCIVASRYATSNTNEPARTVCARRGLAHCRSQSLRRRHPRASSLVPGPLAPPPLPSRARSPLAPPLARSLLRFLISLASLICPSSRLLPLPSLASVQAPQASCTETTSCPVSTICIPRRALISPQPASAACPLHPLTRRLAGQESEAAKAQMDAVFRCILEYCLTQQKVVSQRLPLPPPAASSPCMR